MQPSERGPEPLRTILRERPLWGLNLLVAAFFWRPLFFETFYFRDLTLIYYPSRLWFRNSLSQGRLPLWDPLLNGGQPFLGNPQHLVTYPLHWLSLALPPIPSMNLFIVLHFLLAASFTYALARSVGVRPAGAFTSGVLFAMCGYTLSLANLLNGLCTFCYLPLLILGFHRFFLTRSRASLAIAIFAGSMQVLASGPELIILSFLVTLGWILIYPYQVSPLRRFVFWALAASLAGGIGAVRLLPTIEVIATSSRSMERGYENFATWSVHPLRLPELIVANFAGSTDSNDPEMQWGWRAFEDDGFPYILSIYFGVLPIALALALAIRPRDRTVPSRIIVYLVALTTAGILLALGRHLPGFRLLYEYFPLASTFRFPVKVLALSVLPIALLAGIAVHEIARADAATLSRRFLRNALLVPLSLMFAATLMLAIPSARASFSTLLYGRPLTTESSSVLLLSFAVELLLLLLAVLILSSPRFPRLAVAMGGLITIATVTGGSRVNQYAPRDFFREPSIVPAVRQVAGDGRLHSEEGKGPVSLKVPDSSIMWLQRWHLEILRGYAGWTYGIPVTFHTDFDGLAPYRNVVLANNLPHLPWPRRAALLSAAGVTAILSTDVIDASIASIRPVKLISNPAGTPIVLYRNSEGVPVRFVSNAIAADSPNHALQLVLSDRFDPVTNVVIEGVASSSSAPCEAPRISLRSVSATETAYSVSAGCDGYLVFSENLYPGWRVSVDGQPTAILPANVAFSAVHLKKGAHQLFRRYEAPWVARGAAVSIVSLLAAIAFVMLQPWKRKALHAP